MKRARPIEERFWAKVDKAGPDDCWLWSASTTPAGYGQLSLGLGDGRWMGAHVFSFELHGGRTCPGFYVCHRCDTPGCVNPAHLFLGSPGANVADMDAKGRRGRRVSLGSRNPSAKLTEAQVRLIKSRLRLGDRHQALAGDFRVSLQLIRRISCGQNWAHVQ